MKNLNDIKVREIAEEGTTVEIKHPYSSKSIGLEIDVLGLDSDAAQTVMRVHRQKRNDAAAKRKSISPEEEDQMAIELAGTITRGWRSWDEEKDRADVGEDIEEHLLWDDEELKCTESNALRVYRKHRWIATQVIEAAGDKSRFLPK